MARLHNSNWQRAREYFGIVGQPEMVLHHVDLDLKEKDPERYLEWRVEDLIAIPKGEHTKIHHSGKRVSEDTRAKMIENHVGFKGHNHSEETKQLLRDKLTGVPKSETTKARIRANHARLRGKDNSCAKKVLCVELNKVFYGAAEAGRETGISSSGIVRCCNGSMYCITAGGYHWRYIDD